jgi:hypothetical protein
MEGNLGTPEINTTLHFQFLIAEVSMSLDQTDQGDRLLQGG